MCALHLKDFQYIGQLKKQVFYSFQLALAKSNCELVDSQSCLYVFFMFASYSNQNIELELVQLSW